MTVSTASEVLELPAHTTNSQNGEPIATSPSSPSSRCTSPVNTAEATPAGEQQTTQKKKKKKKSKKSAKAKEAAVKPAVTESVDQERAPVLCISRNKHWRYISSYHGPWLQLPIELLESLLLLNLDPATLSTTESRHPATQTHTIGSSSHTARTRGFASLGDHSPPDSPHSTFANLPPPPPLPAPKPGKATPPPIDPGVFRSVTHIRRLIDEASDLSVRASSGLSAAALGSLRGSTFGHNAAHALGLNGGPDGGVGRTGGMSAARIHKLRALAVQKLSAAYKADEIASSVMVMQGGSVFDDIAEHVLKSDPNDIDARYVHFFHEKIPSRQLAESTTTLQLNELIACDPSRLEFYRTRGIVHCFRDEFALAAKDFAHVIRESRALRKAKIAHRNNMPSEQRGKAGKKKKGKAAGRSPPDGASGPSAPEGPTIDGPDGEQLLLHPSVLPDAPEPIELQCFFLRGAAYLQHAVFLIEEAILKLEGIQKVPSVDGAELRLCYIDNGRYGGVEIGNPDGPLGKADGQKLKAYRAVLAEENFREQISSLVKKSMRDHERFLSHFDSLEGSDSEDEVDIAKKAADAFILSENFRPAPHSSPPPQMPDVRTIFTTYHPLLVESNFSILICQLMLGDFPSLLASFARTAVLVDGLEGYPVFLPPRSMSQAEFIEVLERLAGGWANGIQPHSLSRNGNALDVESSVKSVKGKESSRAPSPPTPTPAPSQNSAAASGSSSAAAHALGVNGSSSSAGAGVHVSEPPSGRETPTDGSGRIDLEDALDAARILLSPVAAKQRNKAEQNALEKVSGKNKGKKKPLSINIPLHGPRVEIILAWLGAVHLTELDTVA